MFTFTLVGCFPAHLTAAVISILFSHLKQGGENKPFVSDLCVSSTLGISGVSTGHLSSSMAWKLGRKAKPIIPYHEANGELIKHCQVLNGVWSKDPTKDFKKKPETFKILYFN